MNAVILDTDALPSPIKEKFHTPRVSVQDRDDGGVILLPLREINELRGIAKGSKSLSKISCQRCILKAKF